MCEVVFDVVHDVVLVVIRNVPCGVVEGRCGK